jgi:hypothetical protein
MLTYTVRFGDDLGIELRPHRYGTTGYRASQSKEGPHVHVRTEQELVPYLRNGWSIRMSGPGHPPSLITPRSVDGWRKS